eukprot:CAMPEP_0181323820 /NCGR_PEP_ID=MMETSP1101-20121128/20009_1 /TAXON_ID=46948 /ORGANISM="Rhodomonas abbreviata, Strain Caron Lab Isolate" /LENGTH=1221 /DNA_ID=CAMNT_0023431913 /DNA_START=228 /DNA_END=3889 /DNA_ORIENTATION=-
MHAGGDGNEHGGADGVGCPPSNRSQPQKDVHSAQPPNAEWCNEQPSHRESWEVARKTGSYQHLRSTVGGELHDLEHCRHKEAAGKCTLQEGERPRRVTRRKLKSAWGTRVVGLLSLLALFLSCQPAGGEHDSLENLRHELGDLFKIKKLLSGTSTYPARYKSFYAPTLQQCSGAECAECVGEQNENLLAVRYELERDILLLEDLGCPCDILSVQPSVGSHLGGTTVTVSVSGLNLSRAYGMGAIDCWVRRDLEDYEVVPAQWVGENSVECITPPMGREFMSQITLHAPKWSLSQSTTQFFFYDSDAMALLEVIPKGVPSSGGAVLTLTGRKFETEIPMFCEFAGRMFLATVQNSTRAYCTSPELPEVEGNLKLSVNGKDTVEPGVPLYVYRQPRILAIWPEEGIGGEELEINAAGLGMRYQPLEQDLLCRFLQQDGNITLPAVRRGNSSTVTCMVPNNTRGVHWISGFVAVELSLIGSQDEVFTNHGSLGPNRFLYRCIDRKTRYATLVDFFPQCTGAQCCPAGYVSNASHCNKCPEATYSFAGAAACLPCPAHAWSPAGSPSLQSCVCVDGFVGSGEDGAITSPGDSCLSCAANFVAVTPAERRREERLSRTVHTLGEYGVSSSCVACPPHARAPMGSNHPTDCSCGAGYMCEADGVPCYQRLLNRLVQWSSTQCHESWRGSTNGKQVRCGGAVQGPEVEPCDPCANASPCGCNCSSPGYVPSATGTQCEDVDECAEGADCGEGVCVNDFGGDPGFHCECGPGLRLSSGRCVDLDECAEGVHGCHADAVCSNTDGSFTCACQRGFTGDGIVDCWDGSFVCSGAVVVSVVTASGNHCWGVPNNETGPPGDFYCDANAGTEGDVLIRIFWLESQQWSEELALNGSQLNFSAGGVALTTLRGLAWTESPAMVQYRIVGPDAWHPDSISVRLYNGAFEFATSGDLCWVDTDSCNELGCYGQATPGCQEVLASSVHDLDECASNGHACDPNAVCNNTRGAYTCACNAGYLGVGQDVLLGPGTSCEPCPAGTYSNAGDRSCTACPDAAYSHSPEGSTLEDCHCRPGLYGNLSAPGGQCAECEENHYCPGTAVDMVPCPANSSSPRGVGVAEDCVCDEGYSGANGDTCVICPPGQTCSGGWFAPEACPRGNYSTAGSIACDSCPQLSTSEPGDPRCSCDAGYQDTVYFREVHQGTCYAAGCSPIMSALECVQGARILGLNVGVFEEG